jgi:peptide/nickel transport system permease protein
VTERSAVALAESERVGGRPTGATVKGSLRRLWRRLQSSRPLLVGTAITAFMIVVALFGPLLLPSPVAMDYLHRLAPPSADHWFGTDNFGRDVMSRVVSGSRLSLFIGVSVVAINIVFGTVLGVLAAYYRSLANPLMRVMDALMAFPAILLALGISAALGARLENVIIALGIVYTPRTARVVRAAVLTVRDMGYVAAARVACASDWWIITRHILPNCFAPLIVQFSFVFAYAILAEAALSFLGAGPPPPAPTWGNIIADGRDVMVEAPWIMLFPGAAISIIVLGLNLMGDGLRDVLDPGIGPRFDL